MNKILIGIIAILGLSALRLGKNEAIDTLTNQVEFEGVRISKPTIDRSNFTANFDMFIDVRSKVSAPLNITSFFGDIILGTAKRQSLAKVSFPSSVSIGPNEKKTVTFTVTLTPANTANQIINIITGNLDFSSLTLEGFAQVSIPTLNRNISVPVSKNIFQIG